ncbi:MAG: double-strand break repair helicase AddA [Rhodospirillaceae bacterium]
MADKKMTETRRQANERQTAASDPAVSHWVSASAGTGKTHVLTNRIVRLLMAGAKPSQILCLTYTKAAATEMGNRLARNLGHWAVMTDDALIDAYRDQTGVPLNRRDLDRVRRLFAEVADTTDGPNIRTIHSFCESLLGRFPLEAQVTPNFTVMDERTAAELRAEARERVLDIAAADAGGPLAAAMDHVAAQVNEDDFDKLMAALDRGRAKLARGIQTAQSIDGFARVVRERLGLGPDDDRASIIHNDGVPADDAALRRAAQALLTGSAADQGRGQAIADWIAADAPARVENFHAYADVFVTQAGGPRKTLITQGAAKSDPGAEDALLAEQQRVLDICDWLKALTVAGNTTALARLGDALNAAYRTLKEERALLDYDDLIQKVRDLLSPGSAARAGAAAWVHYKLDGGIAHVLVDEAQDTAPDQWAILKALADEFYAGEGRWEDGHGDTSRTVFAVGDEKQSIYSFQGADPRGFEAARDHFAARARAAGQLATLDRPLEMAVSFRSVPPVLDCVDRTFEDEEIRGALTPTDRAVRHLADRYRDGGVVELWPVVKPEDEDEENPWDAPLDRPGRRAPIVQVADAIAGTIRRWLDAGENLESKNRPVGPGDILILVRKRGRFMAEMVRALKARAIPVSGSDRMVLTEQLAVMDLMALGRFVLLPEDDLNLATVLKGPLFAFEDDRDLTDLCPGRRGSLWAELGHRADEQPRWRAARNRLSGLLAQADFKPPYEFYADLMGPGGARREFHRHLGPDALDPMEEFLSLAITYERTHVPSLEGFLHWVAAGRTEIKRDLEQAGGEVRVMTVHGAKGLEAPVVFLPDTCPARDGGGKTPCLLWEEDADVVYWPGRKADDTALTRALRDAVEARGADEELRLLYVAMTRAADRLYVTGWEGKTGRADGAWYDLIKDGMARAGAVEVEDICPDIPGAGLRRLSPQSGPVPARPTDIELDGAGLPDWALRPPGAEPEPPLPLTPSRPEDAPPALSPLEDDDGARFKRGLIVHALLQGLPDLRPEDRDAAAARYLARADLNLSAADQSALLSETLGVLTDPALETLFGPGGRAETPLVAVIGGRVMSARLDRLLVTEKEIVVADFKTNRPPPDSPQKVPDVYLRQMAGYRAALAALYPDRPVRAFLVWTVGAKWMELPDDLLARHAPA